MRELPATRPRSREHQDVTDAYSAGSPWAPPRDDAVTRVRLFAAVVTIILVPITLLAALPLMAPSDPLPGETGVADLQRELQQRFVLVTVTSVVLVLLWVVLARWSRGRRRRHVFAPPPGWPAAPDDWRPPAAWQPPAEWPAAPDGWTFWVSSSARERSAG